MPDIPENVTNLSNPTRNFDEARELVALDNEAQLRQLYRSEVGQKIKIKWIAIGVGVSVIFGMAAVLTHLMHSVFVGPVLLVNAPFSVAMIIAPITSITAISVALFVGAFRKFEETDLSNIGNSAVSAANFMRGQ